MLRTKKSENISEYLQIGEIVNTHGIKGELRVLPLSDAPGRFAGLKEIVIEKNDHLKGRMEIENVRYIKNMAVIKMKGIDTLNDAELLKGSFISIHRDNARILGKDEYFICDILGCAVHDDGGQYIGTVKDVIRTGSNDVYVIDCGNGEGERMLPALKSVVRSISLKDKKIIADKEAVC